MKFIIVFVALFAVALAKPADVEIVRLDSDVGPDAFKFGFETSDGASHDAEGILKEKDTDHETIEVKGSYKFVGDDGVTYEVTYIANENGFQPSGAHLPKSPEV